MVVEVGVVYFKNIKPFKVSTCWMLAINLKYNNMQKDYYQLSNEAQTMLKLINYTYITLCNFHFLDPIPLRSPNNLESG